MNYFILFIGVFLFSLNVNGQSNEVKYGGQIGYDRWICPGGEVGPILNLMNPIGGHGDVEFEWISSNTKDIWDSGITINNATAKELNPNTFSETTFFLRKSKRTAQDKFTGNSNIVTVYVSKNTEACKMRPITEDSPHWDSSIYPNPSSDQIHLTFNSDREAELSMTISNMSGAIVFRTNPVTSNKYRTSVLVRGWAAGIYVVSWHFGTYKYAEQIVIGQ